MAPGILLADTGERTMCGRVDLGGEISIGVLMAYFGVTTTTALAKQIGNTDVRPSLTMPVILGLPSGGRELKEFRWGMPPFENKQDDRRRGDLINAKAENLVKFPRYRSALKHRRCVVPVGAFYEWRAEEGTPKKVKYRFTLTDEPVMCLAGICEEGQPGHSDIPAFAIITCTPNELLIQFHDRMPVILDKEAVDVWLDPDFDNTQALHGLLKSYPARKMKAEEAPPDQPSARAVTRQVSERGDASTASVERAALHSENHDDILRNLNAHMRCMFFETRDGVLFYCGVVDPHRPAVRTADGWRCSEHGGQDDQHSLGGYFDT